MLSDMEKRLILALRLNSRVNIKKIAINLNCPSSTLYDTLHKLERENIIKYTIKIDYSKIGYMIQAIIILKTTSKYANKLYLYLNNKKELNNMYCVNNKTTYCIEIICKTYQELDKFLEDIEEKNILSQINVYTIIETLHKEKYLIQ